MSLQRRRERYVILQMWKILHCVSPNDIDILFSTSPRQRVRVKVPQLNKHSMQRHQTVYDTSFAVQGPRLWNTIPCDLTREADFQKFKNSLTGYLSTIPDKPPVTGYSCANRNFILEWLLS